MFDRTCDDCLERLGMGRLAPEDVAHILKNLETMKFSTLIDVMDNVYKSYWDQLMNSIRHPGKRKLIREA